MHKSWKEKLKPLSDIARKPMSYVAMRKKAGHLVYPEVNKIFNAFTMPFEEVKVVMIGQDPYHGINQANGLAFAVNDGTRLPPSLCNIFKELCSDLGIEEPISGELTGWRDQGVMLLNTALTVEHRNPNAHKNIGWYTFVENVVKLLCDEHKNLVFILWGKHAQEFEKVIDTSKHSIIKSPHPSPFSANRGFFGSKPFSKTNKILTDNNKKVIDWSKTK